MPRTLQPGQRAPAHPDDPHSVMVAEQHDGYYLIGMWDARKRRLASWAAKTRHQGTFIDVSDDASDDVIEECVSMPVVSCNEDAAYEAHKDRMLNDLNYRDHYERGGLMKRDE